ncbi:hypothetical protein AB0L44_26890 [Nonomuraea wenchangensis]|uniref:hypothetical protein n=1 Tax=Nonomuraea wenchangensis TaxID=568860 RepID=UPI00342E3177
MALLKLLAINLLGGVVALPFLWIQRGDSFEHARLAALMALDAGQVATVPLGLLVGIVLVATRSWTRTPGYALGSITILFGVIVATQAWATMNWVEGRPSGVGDPDAEFVMALFALFSGVITTFVGVLIVLFRWTGYESQAAPSSRGDGRRSHQPMSHVEGHSS